MSLNFKARSSGFLVDLESMEGACCGIDGSCDFVTALSCYSVQGNRFFHNLTCDAVDCTQGVCCTNGFCSKISEEECSRCRDGVYYYNSDCSTQQCWIDDPMPKRACCFESTGSCSDLHPAQCLSLGGVPQDVGSQCSSTNCAVPNLATGACCVNGVCYGTGVGPDGLDYPTGFTAGDCAGFGGLWGGAGATCNINNPAFGGTWPCTQAIGAACFGDEPLGGVSYCIGGITCGYADELGAKAFKAGVTCGDVKDTGINGVECKGELPGACCTKQKETITLPGSFNGDSVVSGYQCNNLTETQCTSFGSPGDSIFHGVETECDGFDCCSENGDCDNTLGCCGIKGVKFDGQIDTIVQCAFEQAIEEGDPTGESESNYYMSLLECQDIYNEAQNDSEYAALEGQFEPSCDLLRSAQPVPLCDTTTDAINYSFCIFEKNNFEEYVYSTCEAGQVFDQNDIPTAPSGSYSEGFLYSLVSDADGGFLEQQLDGDLCNACTNGDIYPSACCRLNPTTCETILVNNVTGEDVCPNGGDLFLGKQCALDCGTLYCCSDSSLNPVGCIDKSNYDATGDAALQRTVSISGCVDADTLSQTALDEETILQYVSSVNFDVSQVTIKQTQQTCEDCDFDCGRERGSCCFDGTPVHNLTQEECKFLGGLHAGCSGKPFNNVREALNYTPPEIDCSSLEPTGVLNPPRMIRGVGVRQVNDMSRYRRGPYSVVDDMKNAIASDWKTNGWSNGEWKTDKLFWPQKPVVQIFWSPKP